MGMGRKNGRVNTGRKEKYLLGRKSTVRNTEKIKI